MNNMNDHMRQLHYLAGKHFIVIDDSIIKRLGIDKQKNNTLYFQQELTKEGTISLRQVKFKMKKIKVQKTSC
jgi:hypothetical protein